MNENRVSETKLREQQELATRERARELCGHTSGHLVWKIVGGMALAVVAAGLIAFAHDIQRYIRDLDNVAIANRPGPPADRLIRDSRIQI